MYLSYPHDVNNDVENVLLSHLCIHKLCLNLISLQIKAE